MSYEEELEKAKQKYRDALSTSGIGQASKQIGAAIAGVDKPKDDFYSKLGATAYKDVSEVKGKIKEKQKMDLLKGDHQRKEKQRKDSLSFTLRTEFKKNTKKHQRWNESISRHFVSCKKKDWHR